MGKVQFSNKIVCIIFSAILLCAFLACNAQQQPAKVSKDYNVKPVPFNQVNVKDKFWLPRLETNRKVTIPFTFEQCEQTGRIRNFKKAAGLMTGNFEGIYFDDSDVYKIMEGAAYSLQVSPDPNLRKYLDDLIDVIGKAQWEDGYLYNFYSVPKRQPEKRWTDESNMHETYCAGHMYEAAVAHYLVTGDKKFLNIATKHANLVCDVFGPGKRTDPPGHQEIEIGLAKLYRVTGDKKYLDQAKFFLDQRGRLGNRGPDGKGGLYGTYSQDHIPVTEQTKAVGHSVRAAYMFTGMADVAALTGDDSYIKAIDTIWKDVVGTKLYITGGIGAAGGHEGFGGEYELPNMNAYCETCASIANALWNHRMFLMTGDAKYMDVAERVIYNGVLSGISMKGDSFFYPNPLESLGQHERAGWFPCACCPSNVARFVPSVPGYAYAYKGSDIYVNLYIGSDVTVRTADNSVKLNVETNYPWDGKVTIGIEPQKAEKFAVLLRIPGWARNEVVPSDLYSFADKPSETVTLNVNGSPCELTLADGYAVVDRPWKRGDKIELTMPMPVRRIIANEKITDNKGKVALQRGPLVYCLEWPDNKDKTVLNMIIPDDTQFKTAFKADLLNGVQVITGTARIVERDKTTTKPVAGARQEFTAIPYYAWAHRGRGEMTVWPARIPEAARPQPLPTIAYTSKLTVSYAHTSANSIKDQIWPKSSSDSSANQLDFWPHKGTTEWVQYDFPESKKINCVRVYWFDDSDSGECRVPESWSILYRDQQGQFKPVVNKTPYFTDKDMQIELRFDQVETDGLRLEINLQKDWSAGLYEWEVE